MVCSCRMRWYRSSVYPFHSVTQFSAGSICFKLRSQPAICFAVGFVPKVDTLDRVDMLAQLRRQRCSARKRLTRKNQNKFQ